MNMRRFLHLNAKHSLCKIFAQVLLDSSYISESFYICLDSTSVGQAFALLCNLTDASEAQMAPESTPPKFSAPASGRPFKIFCDERTPRRSAPSASNADFYESNDENTHRVPTFKFVSRATTNTKPAPSAKRAPLADVAQEAVGRPRSLSAALAEIAQLKDELEASKDQNRDLKGEIVAYQDALHQADVDMYV